MEIQFYMLSFTYITEKAEILEHQNFNGYLNSNDNEVVLFTQ